MTVDWALGRLRELRGEYAEGEATLLRIEGRRAQVQDAMLRVAGAIQVLEELIAASGAFEAFDALDAEVQREPASAPAT